MTSRVYEVKSTSREVVPHRVTTVSDPTGGAAPTFTFTAADGTTETGTGTWGAWDATRSRAIALSPTLPNAGSTVELAVGRYAVLVEWTIGGEAPDRSPGVLLVKP